MIHMIHLFLKVFFRFLSSPSFNSSLKYPFYLSLFRTLSPIIVPSLLAIKFICFVVFSFLLYFITILSSYTPLWPIFWFCLIIALSTCFFTFSVPLFFTLVLLFSTLMKMQTYTQNLCNKIQITNGTF